MFFKRFEFCISSYFLNWATYFLNMRNIPRDTYKKITHNLFFICRPTESVKFKKIETPLLYTGICVSYWYFMKSRTPMETIWQYVNDRIVHSPSHVKTYCCKPWSILAVLQNNILFWDVHWQEWLWIPSICNMG